MKWLFIALGGAGGSLLRYAMTGWVQRIAPGTFPLGTLSVNILGCFALGLLAGFFAGPQLVREEIRIGLTVGLLGGFTTFSTFGLESFHLANGGEFRLAMMNMLLNCVFGISAVLLGYRLAERWYGV
ncbi:fluoride efflux transporter CrcB [Bythopirellula polymerisocia]|uniref:Fluoride-specific ion channel FluC n=1 Tax=Bythopirellula polymerisocia TaxID=2528003 RepID=A0A5C6CZF0_9BACT|nr:fluoride efflux transporter CrcB [Bythopirellula polymerisocia]TWU29305.1 putative fluoride ion transporter CrcB [Bythopirellula polymerisocia]